MSKKANPTSIGLFFAVGIALTIVGLLLFSSRSIFHPRQKNIVYFTTSLKGLNPGAPVKYRGVTIGTVVEVLIRHNQAAEDFSMPVMISIDKKVAQSKSDDQLQIGSKAKLDDMVKHGFRARLDADSLVTGVLHVGLDFVPNAPPPVYHQTKPEHLEIPSMPTDVQQLLANLAQMDIRGISEKLNAVLAKLDTVFSELNVEEVTVGITNLLSAANRVIASPDLTNSLASLKQTLDQAGTVLKRIDERIDPLTVSVTNTLTDAQKTLAELRGGVRNVSSLLDPNSALRPTLIQALQELGNASRAVADLAEFLERNPNALLTGKSRPKEQP